MGLLLQSNQLHEVEKSATSISVSYSVNEDVKRRLYEIRPKTVIYAFSGGKDSSLALLLTRDFIKKFCEETRCRVYILYIVIAGNTHPLNSYASAYVMEWHRIHYGFEPMYRVAPYVFQLSIPFIGFLIDRITIVHVENRLIFQFHLLDSDTAIRILEENGVPTGLSIPFIGFVY